MKKLLMIAVCCLFSSMALAETCKVDIEANDAMQYNLKEIKIGANCTEVELTLHHVGKLPRNTMGHAWVLAKTADFQALANGGMAAGIDNDYVPAGDARVIAKTHLIGGGDVDTVKFPTSLLQAGGDYTFFCPFPGHNAIMRGKLIFG